MFTLHEPTHRNPLAQPPAQRTTYALVMRDTAFWVVGPFRDEDVLAAWALHELSHGDDPRWQSVSLTPAEVATLPEAHVRPATWHPGYTP